MYIYYPVYLYYRLYLQCTLILLKFVLVQASVGYGDFFLQRDWKKQITDNFITENHVSIPNSSFTEEEDPSR